MYILLAKKKQKHSDNTRKQKYATNPSESDPCYIFDWDDYIEEKKTDASKEEQNKIISILK